MEERIKALESEIQELKNRNARVEVDKAWEVSNCRKLSICLLTYIITMIVFVIIGVRDFYLTALIPTVGYYLSTLSLPFIKKRWAAK